jgi:hypothetical protein
VNTQASRRVLSHGKGRAWVDGITLEVVPNATPSIGVR